MGGASEERWGGGVGRRCERVEEVVRGDVAREPVRVGRRVGWGVCEGEEEEAGVDEGTPSPEDPSSPPSPTGPADAPDDADSPADAPEEDDYGSEDDAAFRVSTYPVFGVAAVAAAGFFFF
nr:hypothetical protein Iba_chr08eCG9320 [Ipomoea batatas]